jgi:hypothetical protein
VPASVTVVAGETTATFVVTTSPVAADEAVTLTASYNGVARTAVVIVVSAPAIPDFSLSASPASRTVTRGASTSYNVLIAPMGSFNNDVMLSLNGLPSDVTASFNPNPATASAALSVTTSPSTPLGSYPITLTGVSGSIIRTTALTLIVAPSGVLFDNAVRSGFQWGVTSITTPAFIIGTGANRAAMIMVAMSRNTATNITVSLGGVSGTLVPGTDTGSTASIRTLIFQVINPPSGVQTATVSWTNNVVADVGVITVTGADQMTPCTNGTFAATNRNSGNTTSVTIASVTGDITASIGFSGRAWVAPYTNRTLAWGIDSNVVGGDIGLGTGTTTHTWTDSYLYQTHAVSGANFKAAAPDILP